MKKILGLCGLVVMTSTGWGAEEMSFVTALSAPIASFQTVETKDCTLVTNIGNTAEVNIGSEATNGGTVKLVNGDNPLNIKNLWIGQGKTLQVGSDDRNTVWMIENGFLVGPGATVTAGGILANELHLKNAVGTTTNATTIQADTLQINSNVVATYVKSSKKFQVGKCEGSEGNYSSCFYFLCNGSTCEDDNGEASSKTLNKQNNESSSVQILGGSTTSPTTYKYIYK